MTDREAMKMALKALEVATTPLAEDRQEVLRARIALREALEQPPEPTESITNAVMNLVDRLGSEAHDVDDRAWDHLRVYLPQVRQEPLAWACQFYKGTRLEVFGKKQRAEQYVQRSLENGADVRLIALYAHPAPMQKPLTDEQIAGIAGGGQYVDMVFADGARGIALDKVTIRDFVRAIEAAHHIGEKK